MGNLYLFAIAFFMIIWGVRNWYIELQPFLDAQKNLPNNTVSDKIFYIFRWIGILPKGFPFAIDIAITLTAVQYLGMGAGLIGGITGVFLSNIISLIIIMRTQHTNIFGAVKITIMGVK